MAPFKVVAMSLDPWNNNGSGVSLDKQSATDGNNSRITISFNPASVCDVTPCTSLVYIQTRMVTGVKADGTTRRVTYVEQGWTNGANIDKDFTPAGVAIDRIWGSPVPYYGVPGGASTPGFSGQPAPNTDKVASMFDRPTRPDSAYPADIKTLNIDFETAVFCRTGPDTASYFGKLTWHWTRDVGRQKADGSPDYTGTITFDAPNRTAPSQNFIDALNRWATGPNMRNFPLPMPTPSPQGIPCP
jgi:hypothetical protein